MAQGIPSEAQAVSETSGGRPFGGVSEHYGGITEKCVRWNMGEKINAIIKAITVRLHTMAAILAKGDRVELIPVKDGVKVMRVKREEVK